ncbi:MAG: DctP family TRAP transporter solute-binding subunit [Halopseudomonas sp.]
MAFTNLGAAVAAPVAIKFSHVLSNDSPKGQTALKFKELAEKRLPGKVSVEVFPSAQLYNDAGSLQALLLGDIQLVAVSLSNVKKYTKKLQIFDLPFLFKDLEAVERFQASPEGRGLLKAMDGKGYMGLGYLHNGMKLMTANDPLRIPSDASGRKFRIMSSDVLAAQYEALGAHPVKKPFSEVFTLLQTKAIDGQENTWSNMWTKKFYEVQDYITETNHGVVEYIILTSSSFWSGLPEDIRAELEQVMVESIAHGNNVARTKAVADRKKVVDAGRNTIIKLTDEQRAQWVGVMRPVWKQFEDQIGKNLIDAAVAANSGP